MPADEIILEKLTESNIAKRWNQHVVEYQLDKIELEKPGIIRLVDNAAQGRTAGVISAAEALLRRLTSV